MRSRPRALLTVLHFHRRGGIEIYTWELAESLRRLGWDVEVLSCLQPDAGVCEGYPHTGLAPADPEDLEAHTARWPQALEELLAGREPNEDLVLAAHPFTLPQVGPYARSHGLPWGTIFYGVEAWDLYDSLRDEIAVGGVVAAISRYTADALERHVAPAAGPVHLLPPLIDTSRFFAAPKAVRRPRSLLTVSRLSMCDWFKGHEVVLEALGPVSCELDEPVRYRIAGEGPYREYLLKCAEALGVADQVEFLGFVPMAELPEVYRQADLFVMPSELGRQDDDMAAGEGFGIVFIEAAACGTPSVGLSHAGAAEAIAHGVSGLAVDHRDEVAGAILRLLRDDDERARLGTQAADWARREFSEDAFDERLTRFLERVRESGQSAGNGARSQASDR